MARPQIDASLMFFSTGLKVYEGKTNRAMIDCLSRLFGDGWWADNGFHYNRFSDYLNSLQTTAQLNWANAEVCSPLIPFVEEVMLDGTGISVTTHGSYRADRYGFLSDTARYLRLNLVMDRRFGIFPVALVTPEKGEKTGELSQAPLLLARLKALGYTAKYVFGDLLYSTEPMHEAILAFGAEPVIPFKTIYTPARLPTSDLMRRFYKQFLADPEAFRARYRYRVLIEAEISALKRRFSENIRSREPIARVNEILFKVLCHNICCIIHAATEHGLDLSVMLRADPLEVFKV
jgi:transposase